MGEIIEVEIVPTRKLFYNNSFGIYAAIPKDEDEKSLVLNSYGNMTIKGKMQELTLEVPYKAKLEGVNDKKYGFGYNVHSIYRDLPKTKEEQKNFLATMMTDLQLEEIYRAFPQEDIIEMFKNNTFDVSKVKGIGNIIYERIRKKVLANVEWQSLFAELGKYGIKFETLKKIVDYFGTAENAIQKVKENPYYLVELHGIGFKKADIIAKNMGISETSTFRIHAGIKHVVGEEENSGHTYIERKDLINKSIECLVIDQKYIENQIDNVDGLFVQGDRIALYKTYTAESDVAKMLVIRLKNSTILNIDIDKFLTEQEEELGISLTKKQKEFFHNFANYNVNFLVGSAGMGKSALQKILINLAKIMKVGVSEIRPDDVNASKIFQSIKNITQDKTLTYRLLAPTGRAAKVLSQYVGDTEASTIHRAVGYGKRDKNEDDEGMYELNEDIIIVDEVSMMDIRLANVLLKKIVNQKAKVVFIGDDFQIPSVSAGNFLRNCLDSGVLPVTKLDKVFRQEEGGGLDIATKIRLGQKFIHDDFIGEMKFGKDTILRSVDQEYMEKGYQHYFKLLSQEYSPEDIMTLTPTKKGSLGTVLINKYIQSIVNPSDGIKKEIVYHDDCTFRVDDFVMNTKNTYEIRDIEGKLVDIVNGDNGIIVDIVRESDLKEYIKSEQKSILDNVLDMDEEEDEIGNEHKIGIHIKFDVGIVAIPFEKMDQLMHGWALTKHKSQGGSGLGVLSIIDKSHKFQLNANLIYTAITRFKEKLIILCQAETLNYALRKFENMRRKTFLEELLKNYNNVKNREVN